MDITTLLATFLMIFWIIWIIIQILSIWQSRRPRQPTPPRRPPRPPSRPHRQQPREPETPPPPIVIESLTLLAKEPSKIRLATKIEPETDCLWPAATLTVNDQRLTGRILPLRFKIANPEGRIVYESSLSHTLKPGFNTISTTDYSFRIKGRRDAAEGSVWEIQLLTGEKMLVRAQFKITEDMVRKLRGEELSKADGELSASAQNRIQKMDAPELEDLIDG